jgi:alanine-glyoxylate transaminase/serine-glyoxylate transaminase/serine-pyruvate transaminase
MTASNLLEQGDNALVVNTGIFGDWFAECLAVYGASVDQVRGDFGNVPSMAEIEHHLRAKKYKMLTITHVDTSSSVIADIKAISALVHQVSPETLVVVDGVCSVAGEEIR